MKYPEQNVFMLISYFNPDIFNTPYFQVLTTFIMYPFINVENDTPVAITESLLTFRFVV